MRSPDRCCAGAPNFESEGVLFRMPADRDALIVDEVWRDGRWVAYGGNRIEPAMFGDFVRVDEIPE